MDVGDLSCKPTPSSTKQNEDDSDYSDEDGSPISEVHHSKISKVTSTAKIPMKTRKKKGVSRFIRSEANEGEVLDEKEVKNLVQAFKEKALWNKEMRTKFPDRPEKFMESELDLHEALQDLSAVNTVPDQYPLLVQLKFINSLLGLLSHVNTDIFTKVVHLLQELTDVEILHKCEEGGNVLISALMEAEAPVLLLHNLPRLDEQVPDEKNAVQNILAILQNMTEFRPEICSNIGKQGFLLWIYRRLKVFLGCPAMWGLPVGFELGEQRMLKVFKNELEFAVQIANSPAIANIAKGLLRP